MSRIENEILQDRLIAGKLVKKIDQYLDDGNGGKRSMRIMHVCGTHEHTIARSGIRSILPPNVDVISGPGCPVCVCHTTDIFKAIHLAERGNIVATFGDMLRVPSTKGSLQDYRSKGYPIKTVYSIEDAIALADQNPGTEVTFFAIGFETFVPIVAASIKSDLPSNFTFLCSLKTLTPIMELLLSLGQIEIDGFITPGHVSAIIGTKPYDTFTSAYRMPIVTAGFEPNDVLMALAMLAKQLHDDEPRNENEYRGVVKREGNLQALEITRDVFDETKVTWRGIGPVPNGGFKIKEKYKDKDANIRFDLDDALEEIDDKDKGIPHGCSCHHVIMGQIKPDGCPLFRSGKCNPQVPIGPCMVSDEGTCRIAYYYREEPEGG
ncbi:MAG: hydrogenase formation protein HypD [Promethearchaeota archaeon]